MVVEIRELNEKIEKELDKQFPKGDPARGRAFVLFAVAQDEIDKLKKQLRKANESERN